MPRIAAEIDAVTSPSWISLMRAPAWRISSIRSWWRGRSRTIVVMSPGRRPKASAIASIVCATGARSSIRPRARGPTAILRMYMSGSVCSDPRGATASIDMAPLAPRATMPLPSIGSTARSTASPPTPTCVPGASSSASSAPMTMWPSIGCWSSASRIARAALEAAAAWSARPSQRAPASAARSVTRAYVSQMHAGR